MTDDEKEEARKSAGGVPTRYLKNLDNVFQDDSCLFCLRVSFGYWNPGKTTVNMENLPSFGTESLYTCSSS